MENINPIDQLLIFIMKDSWHALEEGSSLQNAQLSIILKPDKTNNTLSIIHKADLGARERCGAKEEFTQAFLAGADIISRIDQCLVVDKVTVTTKRNHGDDQYKMESHAGGGSFTVTKDVNGKPLPRGTTMVTLFLKQDQLEYLEERKIRDIVKELPEFIKCHIYLRADEETVTEIEEQVPSGGHAVEQKHKTPTDWMVCMMIKGILGDNVAGVNIAAESFGEDHCRFTSKNRILDINPNSDILGHLRKMMADDQHSVVKAIVLLLFDQSAARSTTTTGPKKAKWRKWAKGLSVCCSVINLTAAVLSCVASGCGGGA